MNTITDYIGGSIGDLLHRNDFLLDGSDKWFSEPQSDADFVALIEAAKSLHHEWIGGFLECYDSDSGAWDMYYVTASLEGLVCDIVPVPGHDVEGFDPDGADFPDRAWSVEALERYIGDRDMTSWLNLDVWDTLPTVWQVDGIIEAWHEYDDSDTSVDSEVRADLWEKFSNAVQRIVADPYYTNQSR